MNAGVDRRKQALADMDLLPVGQQPAIRPFHELETIGYYLAIEPDFDPLAEAIFSQIDPP